MLPKLKATQWHIASDFVILLIPREPFQAVILLILSYDAISLFLSVVMTCQHKSHQNHMLSWQAILAFQASPNLSHNIVQPANL